MYAKGGERNQWKRNGGNWRKKGGKEYRDIVEAPDKRKVGRQKSGTLEEWIRLRRF